MDFDKVLENRKCIRRFNLDKKVTKEQIEKILQAAILAPSAGNIQPWHFVVVKNDGIKLRLTEAALGQSFIMQAPVVIVVCIDLERAEWKYGPRGVDLYSIQATAAACENMFLEVTNLGLGACWVGAFDEKEVRNILKLDENFRPVALLPIGYSAESPISPERRPIDEVTEYKE
jgi:nitroreductase